MEARVALCQIEPWTAMLQFAAALSRSGVTTIRHTCPPGSRSAQLRLRAESLSFTDVVYDVHVGDDGRVVLDVDALLDSVVDVQASERIWDVLVDARQYQQRADLRRSHRAAEPALSRKDRMYAFLAEYGLPVPSAVASANGVPVQWPVVVKRPVGYGGAGVRLATDPEQFLAVIDTWELTPSQVVVEPVLHQPQVNVGGVADGGTIIVAGAYRPTPPRADRFGPPVSLQVVDHPEAMAITVQAVEALGLTGPFCLNMMAGDDGLVIIDVNVRIFGSWLGLQQAGFDLLGAYLWRLGLGPKVEQPSRFRPAPILVDFDPASWRGAGRLVWQSLPYVGIRGALGEVSWAVAKHRYA